MTSKIYTYDGAKLTAAVATQGIVVPKSTTRVIRAAFLCNTTTAPVQVTITFLSAAAVVVTALAGVPIAPGDTYLCDELVGQSMAAGTALQAVGAGVDFKYTAIDIVN